MKHTKCDSISTCKFNFANTCTFTGHCEMKHKPLPYVQVILIILGCLVIFGMLMSCTAQKRVNQRIYVLERKAKAFDMLFQQSDKPMIIYIDDNGTITQK